MRRSALVLIFWAWAAGLPTPPPAAADTDVGDIAVIETDPTILQPGELFDLNGQTVTFTPSTGGGYTVSVGALNFDTRLGSNLGLGDDASVSQPLSFTFPFFGSNRTSVFINSNGYLTFDGASSFIHFNEQSGGSVSTLGDASTVLDRMAAGFRRIAVLSQDWNPAAGGGVFANSLSDRLIVTWSGVPLFGTATTATFQVILFNTGVIQMNYQSVTTTPGGGYLVGLSPGLLSRVLVTTIDLSQGSASSISAFPNSEPLVQVFGSALNTLNGPLVHINAVARRFYQTHGDDFDQLVMFANFTHALQGFFNVPIQPAVAGIGHPGEGGNISSFFGSAGRLGSFLNMNRLELYPADPNTNVPGVGTNSTLDLMGQESGHHWLAFVEFDDGGVNSKLLLGRANAHWSFFHDTDAADMEGNNWQDNGDGTFTSIEATERFSPLDQYIMGLRPAAEVPDFFFIRNPSAVGCFRSDPPPIGERSCPPQIGVTVPSGTRQDVTLNQVILREGARSPSSGFSGVNPTTSWKQAFILLIPGGTTPPPADLTKIETIRAAWVPYFNVATAGRGFVDTTLPPPPPAETNLVNISTRGIVGTGDDVMIGGFIIEGTAPKTVLVRARGPTLADFGVPGVLANPSLQLFSQQTTPSTLIVENNNWQDAQEAAIIATGLDPCQPLFDPGGPAPTGCTLESAILITLNPGAYTAIVRGVGGGTGVGLVEVFEVDGIPTTSKLVNISTRGLVGTVDDVMIGGFIIGGSTPKTVLVRARGPTLADFGVPGVLANPFLRLFSGQTVIAQNDNWQDDLEAEIIATGLDLCQPFAPGGPPPTGCTLESAILITLNPGAYTAIVSGGIGVGLVEIFEVNVPGIPGPLDFSGNYGVTGSVTSSTCPGIVPPGTPVSFSITVSQTGQDLIFTDPFGDSLTGTLTGRTSFTVTGTFSEAVPGTSCVLTDTVTWNGTADPFTLNFSAAATEFVVSNNPAQCAGFVSCTVNETLVGTRVSALQFQELQAAPGAAGFDQLLRRLEIP